MIGTTYHSPLLFFTQCSSYYSYKIMNQIVSWIKYPMNIKKHQQTISYTPSSSVILPDVAVGCHNYCRMFLYHIYILIYIYIDIYIYTTIYTTIYQRVQFRIWVCLKIGYIPNEIVNRDCLIMKTRLGTMGYTTFSDTPI